MQLYKALKRLIAAKVKAIHECRRQKKIRKYMRRLYCLQALEKIDIEAMPAGYIAHSMKRQKWRYLWTIPAFRGQYLDEE